MRRIIASDEWKLKDLELFVEAIEIRSEQGKLIGVFVPANLERGEQLYAQARASLNPTQLRREFSLSIAPSRSPRRA